MTRPVPWRRVLIVVIALLVGGWLLFDGARAFIVGDYVTPSSGDYAGRLGPWAGLLEAVGLNPRGGVAKGLHLATGAAWGIAVVAMITSRQWAAWAVVVAAIASLWYLPFGTIGGIVALAMVASRSAAGAPAGLREEGR